MKGRPSRTRRRPGGRRRRSGARPLWPLLGLALVGAVAAVLASRRPASDEVDEPAGQGEGPEPVGEPERAGESEPAGEPEPAGKPEAAEAEQLWIAGPAGNLFVRVVRRGGAAAGGRLPVLFVHSLAGNGGQWALQLDHLRRRRQALAVDLRGHGDSDPAEDGAYDVAAFAADVVAVADHFALRRFVLAGHSLGAAVAIAYAAAHPQRVAGLLLVDPNGDQTRIPRQQIEPFLAALRAEPLAELESYFRQLVAGGDRDAAHWVIEDLRLTHEGAVAPAVAAAVEFAPLPALARYPGPRLAVISTANDLPYSLHKLLPELPVQLVRGTGHWLMMDRPEIFNGILETFLEQVENAVD
ncbi:MAG TPA: alpha/beta fold hydrolase [Thermoanaerobaculia bacterium]|jgi:pimeloyl-ACP methyl ester carboxylesterase|nr:alpha/beta fold hydrolase [Thermoanaerobaculia bacterium]